MVSYAPDELYSNIRILEDKKDIKKYDLIIVPGYGFIDGWQLSDHVKNRLELAAQLYNEKVAPKIALSGKWSLTWEKKGIIPPITESRKMEEYLLGFHVPEKDIFIEEDSMDSIGNAYYLKKQIIEKHGYKRIFVLCADYIVERASFCYGKMFEQKYSIDLLPTETQYAHDKKLSAAQEEMSQREQHFLQHMKKGDDAFWGKEGYTNSHYTMQRPVLVDAVGLGGKL